MPEQRDFITSFLNALKKKIKVENGVDLVLWSFCPSFMKLRISFKDPKMVDFEKIEKLFLKKLMNMILLKN